MQTQTDSTMNTSSDTNDGGNLTRREALVYKMQLLAIVIVVCLGIARGYTMKIEHDREALQTRVVEINGALSDCMKKNSIDDQAVTCKKFAVEAENMTLAAASIAASFPNRQLLGLFGSSPR
jgi:hypothetical protein